jgi:hypothetical protein
VSVSARTVLGAIGIVLVIAVIGGGLYLVGNPADERTRRIDERRVQDLTMLRDAVLRYAGLQKRLPASLQDVRDLPDAARNDPVTGRPYAYRVTGDATYELCADFERPSQDDMTRFADYTWKHGAGRVCFPQAAAVLQKR